MGSLPEFQMSQILKTAESAPLAQICLKLFIDGVAEVEAAVETPITMKTVAIATTQTRTQTPPATKSPPSILQLKKRNAYSSSHSTALSQPSAAICSREISSPLLLLLLHCSYLLQRQRIIQRRLLLLLLRRRRRSIQPLSLQRQCR